MSASIEAAGTGRIDKKRLERCEKASMADRAGFIGDHDGCDPPALLQDPDGHTDAAAALPRNQFIAVKSKVANTISTVATARIEGSI